MSVENAPATPPPCPANARPEKQPYVPPTLEKRDRLAEITAGGPVVVTGGGGGGG